MKTFRLGVVAVVAFVLLGAWALRSQPKGGDAGFTDALREHVRTERFDKVATVSDLPAAVREALAALFREATLDLAEPGARFQATDVVVGPRLPARRLITGGCSADHCLVYYERGGFAHVHQIVLFSKDDTSARFVHGGVAAGGLTDLEQVRDALVSDEVRGSSKYW